MFNDGTYSDSIQVKPLLKGRHFVVILEYDRLLNFSFKISKTRHNQ